MSDIKEQEKLIELLKFTPCTYNISMWGYGGEYVMGTVSREIYDYFRHRRLNLSDFAWDDNYAEKENIPEEMWPFPPGSWYECDDMGHVNGVDRNAGTLQITDQDGNVVYERELENITGGLDENDNPEPEWCCNDEIWVEQEPAGTVVFVGTSSEKGTFFEGEINLTSPFDPGKLTLGYTEIDGNEIIDSISYNENEIDNNGGGTTGKGSVFGFYVVGSQQDGSGERYKDLDDIKYPLSAWFPAKVNPVRPGEYNVRIKDGYEHRANWSDNVWTKLWGDPPEKLKVKEWQGIAIDPDL